MWNWFLHNFYWAIPVGFLGLNILLILLSIWTWHLKWAVFVKDEDLPAEALKGKHNDWWGFISWAPRNWNAFINGDRQHQWPKKLFGNNERRVKMWTKDGVILYDILYTGVPNPGTWNICWPFLITFVTKKFKYFRWGIRKDIFGDNPNPIDGDDYWVLGAAFKTIKPFEGS